MQIDTLSLRGLCRQYTSLTESEIETLEEIQSKMEYIADLTGSDVFIDCMDKAGKTAIVVAQAKPNSASSNYAQIVLGQEALQKNEPAVYHAFSSGMPVRDIKAITQENRIVKQDAVPIKNSDGKIIAVLIREKDISRSVQREKKYQALAKQREDINDSFLSLKRNIEADEYQIATREIHHRVKNNLQMVASILNLQSRKTKNPELRKAFQDNTNRVLSIAATHDILTNVHTGDEVSLKPLIEKIRRNIQSIIGEGKAISIHVTGDDLTVSGDHATSIALVINELITNALKYGFEGREQGKITILLQGGSRYSTIIVEDDGVGFQPTERSGESLGLDIVALTVRDKLGGELRIQSGKDGTKVVFDYKVQS